jgi:hypothetical protein
MPDLRELEQRFFRALTRPHGTDADPALVGWVRGDAALTAAERLDVYANMYCARLVGGLLEDFPEVAAALGHARFDEVAHAYLALHPSEHPSLRWAGRAFADFLGELPPDTVPAFVLDLARLEWARMTVFDAPDAPVLALERLRALPAERWPALPLSTVPALETLDLGWPVHEWSAAAAGTLTPRPTSLRVWRRGCKVAVAAMDDFERRALAAVQHRCSFAGLCELVGTELPEEEAASEAAALVVRWIEDEILRAAADGEA